MIHCFKQCSMTSDDEYRTRYDCTICHKTFYALKRRTSSAPGHTLLINGTPHITCGNEECNQIERLHDSRTIRIFLGWEEIDQVYVWIEGVRVVKPRFRPRIRTVPGCRSCANKADHETARFKRPYCFNMNMKLPVEPKITKSTTIYRPKQDVEVVWDGSGYLTTEYDTPYIPGLHGPYSDRKMK